MKADGTKGVALDSVGRVLRKRKREPSWQGERQVGSGAARKTSKREDAALVRLVKAGRGMEKMTAGKARARLPSIKKKLGERQVQRRLREARLKWLRRRRKTLVPAESKEARMAWARWVRRLPANILRRWVYTDGVTFYVDRGETDRANGVRAALGIYVWRHTEQRDALFEDCVGPSSYRKGQGEPVRVWGLLVDGTLHLAVLPAGKVMNRHEYEWLVRHRFQQWLGRRRHTVLVQDHERCLWCDEPQTAMREIGLKVCTRHPKHSPDLNAIENAWALLRARLDATRPCEREGREAFLTRLRNAARWVNDHHRHALLRLSRNQQQRASDVLKVAGARTAW